ncbi:AAA family ATPase [Synechococcus sp. N32]|uniref:AAA family ATPase n=1 Tax=Synechococcus sp. N32 TaxID=2575514 RepID=UPI001483C8CC|nr:AAA family ATPase [Synechococcus sp. N32]
MTMGSMRHHSEGKRARHVIVIAGASGCGKTHLIQKLSRPPHDEFIRKVLEKLDCNPNQRLKRSTLNRMQRLMDPANAKKQKTQKLEYCLLLHIDLTSINHHSNLKRLRQTLTNTTRLDVITLYTTPHEWRERIINRIHTDNEPSMRAALIALSGKISSTLSAFLYHREYKKWSKDLQSLDSKKSIIINTFNRTIYSSANTPF